MRPVSTTLLAFLLLLIAGAGAPRGANAGPAHPTASDKALVVIDLIDFDPAVGDVHARLHLRLPPGMVTKDESPVRDLTLVDRDTVDESILRIPAKEAYSYNDAFLNARYQVDDPGAEFKYPFDVHETNIDFFVAEEGTGPIPVTYDCTNCSFDGFKVTVTDAGSTPTEVKLNVMIRRSTPIIVFSLFLAIAMWAMTILVLILAIRTSRQKSKAPEVPTMGFIGGLLFAYPAIRGAQPRVPPMGVLSDYYGFFWNELILIIALAAVMFAWVTFPHEDK